MRIVDDDHQERRLGVLDNLNRGLLVPQSMRPPESTEHTTIDALAWLGRATLDVIGLAGKRARLPPHRSHLEAIRLKKLTPLMFIPLTFAFSLNV